MSTSQDFRDMMPFLTNEGTSVKLCKIALTRHEIQDSDNCSFTCMCMYSKQFNAKETCKKKWPINIESMLRITSCLL